MGPHYDYTVGIMIELTLEQAQHLVDGFSRSVLTEDHWKAITYLMGAVSKEQERWAPKPSPRFTVWETRLGGSFFIRDTVKDERYDDFESCIEREAQDYADSLNRCEPANG